MKVKLNFGEYKGSDMSSLFHMWSALTFTQIVYKNFENCFLQKKIRRIYFKTTSLAIKIFSNLNANQSKRNWCEWN